MRHILLALVLAMAVSHAACGADNITTKPRDSMKIRIKVECTSLERQQGGFIASLGQRPRCQACRTEGALKARLKGRLQQLCHHAASGIKGLAAQMETRKNAANPCANTASSMRQVTCEEQRPVNRAFSAAYMGACYLGRWPKAGNEAAPLALNTQ